LGVLFNFLDKWGVVVEVGYYENVCCNLGSAAEQVQLGETCEVICLKGRGKCQRVLISLGVWASGSDRSAHYIVAVEAVW
jgi:hypothetical protein